MNGVPRAHVDLHKYLDELVLLAVLRGLFDALLVAYRSPARSRFRTRSSDKRNPRLQARPFRNGASQTGRYDDAVERAVRFCRRGVSQRRRE